MQPTLRSRSTAVLIILGLAFTADTRRASAEEDTPEIPFEPPPPPKPRDPAPPPPAAEPTAPPAAAEDAPAPAPAPAAQPSRRRRRKTEAAPPPSDSVTVVTEPASEPGGFAAPSAALRLSPTLTGESGLLRVHTAGGPPAKSIRLGFGIDLFSASDVFQDGDDASRVGATLSVSAAPIDHLELWINTRAQSSKSTLTDPELLQAQGDLTLGAKGHYPVSPLFAVGADAQLTLLSSIGSPAFDFSSPIVSLGALVTADVQRVNEKVPLRAHLNLGVILDGSNGLATEALSNPERFALGISDHNRVYAGIAFEVPVKYVTPFIEYSLEIPLGYIATPGIFLAAAKPRTNTGSSGLRQAQVDESPLGGTPIARPAVQRVFPQRIAPGVRVTALRDLTFDLAVEIGLTPDVGTGVLATPPYQVSVMASYALDPWGSRGAGGGGEAVAVPVLVPDPMGGGDNAGKGQVAGVVVSKSDGKIVEGAVIRFDRAPPVASAETGRFVSHDMEPGLLTLTISKDGFLPRTTTVSIDAGGEAEISVALVPAIREGVVKGKLRDAEGRPISGASIEVVGGSPISAGSNGDFELKLKEGEHLVVARANGFYKKIKKVKLQAGQTLAADFILRTRTDPPVAELGRGVIRTKARVPFEGREAKLAPEAPTLLDAVIDVMAQRPEIKRIRVEGHTDNGGDEEADQRLSKQRADAVVQYLVGQGFPQEKLEAVGHGSKRPVAPNLTQRGRDQNLRIEFVLEE